MKEGVSHCNESCHNQSFLSFLYPALIGVSAGLPSFTPWDLRRSGRSNKTLDYRYAHLFCYFVQFLDVFGKLFSIYNFLFMIHSTLHRTGLPLFYSAISVPSVAYKLYSLIFRYSVLSPMPKIFAAFSRLPFVLANVSVMACFSIHCAGINLLSR
ncbi:hypothetical protein ES703_89357 [subsurface metagenome]